MIKLGRIPSLVGIPGLIITEALSSLLSFYFWAIILQAILSWVASQHHSPVMEILYRITEPLLRAARRLLPQMSGIDLSPMLVIFLFYATNLFIMQPLTVVAYRLALGG